MFELAVLYRPQTGSPKVVVSVENRQAILRFVDDTIRSLRGRTDPAGDPVAAHLDEVEIERLESVRSLVR